MDICREEEPSLEDIEGGQFASCWLYPQVMAKRKEQSHA
jgi:hypothetical protein